ncbi:glycosyltransferase domain-containing protein [Methanobrevibacter sp. DSM 116169]|uniref:glycosyltransferase domain-containing protein n=1 Tax=Methanobrevibacter sp. DSM 116169 TaxID=3242727 RepID=UPI0038FC66A6
MVDEEKIDPYEVIKGRHEGNVENFIKKELFAPFKEVDKNIVEDIKNNKLVIYTAFTGDYDTLKDPEFIDENCDYICFSDNPDLKSNVWEIRQMEDSNLDDNRKAKQYKVLTHKYLPEYKYSFWIDGTFKIKGSIREYIYKYINSPMLLDVHPERDCIYDEGDSSCEFSRYSNLIISKQIENYYNEKMPKHYGLPVLGAIFREHNNPKIIELMNSWWEEIIIYTNQDQISLTYLMWKFDFHPSVSDVYYWINEYWSKEGKYHHKKEITSPLCSTNLIENLEGNIKDINHLKKEELYLLFNDIDTLKHEASQKDAVLNYQEIKIRNLKNTFSWKITKPLRFITDNIRKIK